MTESAVREVIGDSNPTKVKQERVRSAIDFPYNSLDDAVAVVKAVYRLGGNQCRLDSLAAELGHDTVNSGGFRQKLSSATKFGLSSQAQGEVTLTPLGARIVDPDQERAARVEAFLFVPLYRAIYEDFKAGALPPVSGLEARFVALGVPEKQKDKARQVFQRSAKEAGFFAYGTTKLVYPALGNLGPQKAKDVADTPPDQNTQNGSSGNGGGGGPELPPYVQLLVSKLPKPETMWQKSGRKKWLEAALKIFDLVFEEDPGDDELELKITLGPADSAK